jgi:hypothetical protein
MQAINSETSLRRAIVELEMKRTEEGIILKNQFHKAYNSFKPGNLLISTIKEVFASSVLKGNLLNTSVGLTAGYLSKLVLERGTKNPVKRLLGNAAMLGITNLVAKNPETIRYIGTGLLRALIQVTMSITGIKKRHKNHIIHNV